MTRGWTTLEDKEVSDAVAHRAKVLMEEWTRLHEEEEQEGRARQRSYEDGEDFYHCSPDCEETYEKCLKCFSSKSRHLELQYGDGLVLVCPRQGVDFNRTVILPSVYWAGTTNPGGICSHDRAVEEQEKLKYDGRRLRMSLVEEELASLGLRKMRPYEHHQEEERYYQYMEEGRFGHYSE